MIALSSQHSEHTDFFSFSSTNSVTKILYLGYLFACARGFALQIRPAGLPAGISYTLAPGKKKHPIVCCNRANKTMDVLLLS